MSQRSLNWIYSKPTMSRRYEVWFLKILLADGSGAWWIRYLLMNLGRKEGGEGCGEAPRGMPVQVWATWFPKDGRPQGFIQGFSKEGLSLNSQPFSINFRDNRIDENSCAGRVETDGHTVSWNLRYSSTLSVTMSDAGRIGFSRTPHSNATFSGEINFDGRTFAGEVLGYGLQGHNCGYRHRHTWTWTHMLALDPDLGPTTFEALEYEIGAGLMFRKALLWHEGTLHTFRRFSKVSRDRDALMWMFTCYDRADRLRVEIAVDGGGDSLYRLPYMKTDCSGTFEVSNNSLAARTIHISRNNRHQEPMRANGGATIEMVGGR